MRTVLGVLVVGMFIACGGVQCPEHTTEVDGGACQLDPCFGFTADGGVAADPSYVCGPGDGEGGAYGCRCTS